jgi:phosphomannomutase
VNVVELMKKIMHWWRKVELFTRTIHGRLVELLCFLTHLANKKMTVSALRALSEYYMSKKKID